MRLLIKAHNEYILGHLRLAIWLWRGVMKILLIVFILVLSSEGFASPVEMRGGRHNGTLNLKFVECRALVREPQGAREFPKDVYLKKIFLEFVNGVPVEYEKKKNKITNINISSDFVQEELLPENFFVDFLDKDYQVFEPLNSEGFGVYVENFDELSVLFNTEFSVGSFNAKSNIPKKDVLRRIGPYTSSEEISIKSAKQTFVFSVKSGFFYLADVYKFIDMGAGQVHDINFPIIAGLCDMNTAYTKVPKLGSKENPEKVQILNLRKNYKYTCDTNIDVIESLSFTYRDMLTPEAKVVWSDGQEWQLLEYSISSTYIPEHFIQNFNRYNLEDSEEKDPLLKSHDYYIFNPRRQVKYPTGPIVYQDYFKGTLTLSNDDKSVYLNFKEQDSEKYSLKGKLNGYDFEGQCLRKEIPKQNFEQAYSNFKKELTHLGENNSSLLKDILRTAIWDTINTTAVPHYADDGPSH